MNRDQGWGPGSTRGEAGEQKLGERERRLCRRILRLGDRRIRDRSGSFFVKGIRPTLRVLDGGYVVESLVQSEILLQNPYAHQRIRLARSVGVPSIRLSPEQFRRVSATARASGIGAVARQRWAPLELVDPGDGLCWIATRYLRSAGNLGTILRTAEATGTTGLIVLGNELDPFDRAVIRASMGSLFGLKLSRTCVEAFSAW